MCELIFAGISLALTSICSNQVFGITAHIWETGDICLCILMVVLAKAEAAIVGFTTVAIGVALLGLFCTGVIIAVLILSKSDCKLFTGMSQFQNE